MTRSKQLAVLCALALAAVATPTAAGGASGASEPNLGIVSGRQQISEDDVRGADITGSAAGRDVLESFSDSININARPYRVFAFGDQRTVVDAATTLRVCARISWTSEARAARLSAWWSRRSWWARCSVESQRCGHI